MIDVLIVGAGHAGTQLAASLREAGHGGAITLVSAEPDWPYHRPPLSKSFMQAPDTPLQLLRAERFFANKNIDLQLGVSAVELDCKARRVGLSDGRMLRYDKLVLATGCIARRLSIPGAELAGVHYLRTADDARALRAALPQRQQIVVIGGGFIGLEAAAMLRARQSQVTVLEMAPALLGRAVSAPTAAAVADCLQNQGVDIRCSIGIERMHGHDGRVNAVQLSDAQRLPAELVIVGIGALPQDELARVAGLRIDNGIQVDEHMRSSDPDVFAIGDCARFPQAQLGLPRRLESVQNATDQARALATTLTGRPIGYHALPWFWSDIGALRLQIAGLADQADEALISHHSDGRLKSVYRLAAGRLVALETLDSTGEHMLARKMIAEGITPPVALMRSGDTAALKAFYQLHQAGFQPE